MPEMPAKHAPASGLPYGNHFHPANYRAVRRSYLRQTFTAHQPHTSMPPLPVSRLLSWT